MAEDIIRREENVDVEGIGSRISDDIGQIIEHSKHAVAVYLNTEVTLTYWRIGRCIANELDAISDEKYGSKIVSTVSRQLTERFGKGYQRANLFRMLKVARVFPDEETDSTDYALDLLFYHRRLRRLLAIDLKLGKFKPEYKGQMELYLKYLNRYERQPGEEEPIGLLLCSEGNTEHIELMMLDEPNIKVAQYLTILPDKQWFIDKLNRSILIARELQQQN